LGRNASEVGVALERKLKFITQENVFF